MKYIFQLLLILILFHLIILFYIQISLDKSFLVYFQEIEKINDTNNHINFFAIKGLLIILLSIN